MRLPVAVFAFLSSITLCGQVMIRDFTPGGTLGLLLSDSAVLDIREVSTSLPCEVKPVRPELGFDLGFHTGYQVSLRLRHLAGEGLVLTSIFRVIPENNADAVAYFQQKWTVPAIAPNAVGAAILDGSFVV